MTTTFRAARDVALVAAVSLIAACGGAKSGRSDYARDGDTGAASPGSTPTLNSPAAPDSTAGVSQRTGMPGVAGDTIGTKGKATGGTNPTASGRTPPATHKVP